MKIIQQLLLAAGVLGKPSINILVELRERPAPVAVGHGRGRGRDLDRLCLLSGGSAVDQRFHESRLGRSSINKGVVVTFCGRTAQANDALPQDVS